MGFDKSFKLHVKGDMQVDGKCFVSASAPVSKAAGAAAKKPAAKKPAAKKAGKEEELDMTSELDFADLLEEDEGVTDNVSEHGIDVSETLHGLSRVLRKQHSMMHSHDQRIAELSE